MMDREKNRRESRLVEPVKLMDKSDRSKWINNLEG